MWLLYPIGQWVKRMVLVHEVYVTYIATAIIWLSTTPTEALPSEKSKWTYLYHHQSRIPLTVTDMWWSPCCYYILFCGKHGDIQMFSSLYGMTLFYHSSCKQPHDLATTSTSHAVCCSSSLTRDMPSAVWPAGLVTCVCVLRLLPDRRCAEYDLASRVICMCLCIAAPLLDGRPAECGLASRVARMCLCCGSSLTGNLPSAI